MDAEFLSVVENGQYFMTKDNGEQFFQQWLVVNTFFQEMIDHHNQEDGSSETQKIEPVLEVTTSCLCGKHGVEIRIRSLSGDNTHSGIRISHGSN